MLRKYVLNKVFEGTFKISLKKPFKSKLSSLLES